MRQIRARASFASLVLLQPSSGGNMQRSSRNDAHDSDEYKRFPPSYPRLPFNAEAGDEIKSPRLVSVETEKFRVFIVSRIETLENELLECMQNPALDNDDVEMCSSKFCEMLSKAEDEILKLDEYFWTAKKQISRDHIDDVTKVCELKFESVILLLSECHAIIRDGLNANSGKEDVWKPPNTFERKTTKFWVPQNKVIQLQLAIMKHLPILNFKTSNDLAIDNEDEEYMIIDRDAKKITSVYFDTPDLHVYYERLNRMQGATLVRCRWYGSKEFPTSAKNNDDDIVFFERKTHHESWSLENSVKERFSLPRVKALNFFESGKISTNDSDRQRALARDIFEKEFKEKSLSPAIRTSYRRTAFQKSDNNEVRISLDTDLTWFDEISNQFWIEENAEDTKQTVIMKKKFPFAVLEVKLQNEETPEWIEDIVREIHATEVYKFSKFLHGTCVLRGTQIQRFPHWWDFTLNADNSGIAFDDSIKSSLEKNSTTARTEKSTTQATTSIQITSTNSHTRSGAGIRDLAHVLASAISLHRFRNYTKNSRTRENDDVENQRRDGDAMPPSSQILKRGGRYMPIKIEPKTFFANERTLLQWLSMSTLLLFLSLGLLAFEAGSPSDTINLFRGDNTGIVTEGSSAISKRKIAAADMVGLALAPVAILFMVYALVTYLIRANRIARREPSTRYDDIFGPSALVSVLVLVSIASIILVAKQLSWKA